MVDIYGHENKETNIWQMLVCLQCDVCGVISFAAIRFVSAIKRHQEE
jgi:hypothetical protein